MATYTEEIAQNGEHMKQTYQKPIFEYFKSEEKQIEIAYNLNEIMNVYSLARSSDSVEYAIGTYLQLLKLEA